MLKFLNWFPSGSESSRRAAKRSGRRRLRLEGLEGRDLLSAVSISPKAALVGPPNAPAIVAAAVVAPPVQNSVAAAAAISSVGTSTSSSESALVAGINAKRFNGNYVGKYTYKLNGHKYTANIRFSVVNGVTKVTVPGRGAGAINAQGNINFKITGNITLKGHFSLVDANAKANGTFAKRWGSRVISGSWSATRIV